MKILETCKCQAQSSGPSSATKKPAELEGSLGLSSSLYIPAMSSKKPGVPDQKPPVKHLDPAVLEWLANSNLPTFGPDPSLTNHKFSYPPKHILWANCDTGPNPDPIPDSRRVPTSVYYPYSQADRKRRSARKIPGCALPPYWVTYTWPDYYEPVREDTDLSPYYGNSAMWKRDYLDQKLAEIDRKKQEYEEAVEKATQEQKDDTDSDSGQSVAGAMPLKAGRKVRVCLPVQRPDTRPSSPQTQRAAETFPYKEPVTDLIHKFKEQSMSPDQRETVGSQMRQLLEEHCTLEAIMDANAHDPIPTGFDKYGEEYGFIDPRAGITQGHYWDDVVFNDIIVSRIVGPNHFYVQNLETEADLEQLNCWMTAWYDVYWPTSPTPSKADIVINGTYAVYMETYTAWFRGVVEDFVAPSRPGQETEIVIRLVDYGSVALVTLEHLLPLRRIYAELPTQAAIAQLHVVPERIWTTEEMELFLQTAGGRKFTGLIMDRHHTAGDPFIHLRIIMVTTVRGNEAIYDLNGRLNFGFTDRLAGSPRLSNDTDPDMTPEPEQDHGAAGL